MPEELIDFNQAFEELANSISTSKTAIEITTFENFIIDVFSLSYPEYNFDTWHVHSIGNFLDRVLASENKMSVSVLPRYHLKSTLLGYAFSIYRMLTAFGDGLYISYKDELANFHLSNIKNAISRNPILNPIMKDLRPQSTAGIEYKIGNKRVRMFSSGIFAMKRGLHTDLCTIVDDVLGTVENPLSMLELDKAKLMFNTEVQNIPNRDCPLIVFGTVMSYSDLLFDLKDNAEFMSLWYPALNPDKDHEVLWEDKYPKEWLEKKKRQSGWKSFSTEFLLMPVMATEAFFTREELDNNAIDSTLKNHSIYRIFNKEWHHVVAGLDIGKRRNPSHLSIFVDNDEGVLTQLHQEFWDGMEYTEQIEKIKAAVENFKIDKLYIDATRGEMEERGLPRECMMVKFTGRGFRSQSSYATDFAKYVENKKVKLLDDTRFINQITCVTNDLKAPESPLGHGDCYDQYTEILTDKGWKLFEDLDKTEQVATLNSEGFMEWQKPTDYIVKYRTGQMYQVKSTQVDLIVTPLHKMYVNGIFKQPEDIFNKQVHYKKDAKWKGEEVEFITVLGKQIKMDDWLEFMGYYISEGHTTKRKGDNKKSQSCISQGDKKRDKIRECLNRLPFKYTENKNGFWIYNSDLGALLLPLGKSYDKYIPKELLNLSTRQLNILYEALMYGDGTFNKTFRQYYTSSIKLANQFQELLLKIGKSGNIYIRDWIGRKAPHGITRGLCYAIGIIEKKNNPMVNKQKSKGKFTDSWIPYTGWIYCVTVPNHIVYVRRNGKPCWSGNSFWSVALSVGAYQDYFAPDRVKGFSYLGDAQETLEIKKGVALSKDRNDICKMCNKRTVRMLEDGSVHCDSCFTTYTLMAAK